MWKFQGSIKKEVQYPGVFTKTHVEFQWVLVLNLGIHQAVSHNFAEFTGVTAYTFYKGKVTNLKNSRGFFQKSAYILKPPPVWSFSGIAQYL